MFTISDINKMQDLLIKSKLIVKSSLGYCKYDIEQTEEIKPLITALEKVDSLQEEIEKTIENVLQS